MKIILLLALLLSMSGCILPPSDGYNVYISPKFSPEQTSQIRTALHLWQEAVGVLISEKDTCDNDTDDVCIVPVSQEQMNTFNTNKLVPGEFGFGYTLRQGNQSSWVYIVSSLGSDVFAKVALHESGHIMGLHHTQHGTVLCYEVECQPTAITCADKQQYWAIRGVDIPCSENYHLTGQ